MVSEQFRGGGQWYPRLWDSRPSQLKALSMSFAIFELCNLIKAGDSLLGVLPGHVCPDTPATFRKTHHIDGGEQRVFRSLQCQLLCIHLKKLKYWPTDPFGVAYNGPLSPLAKILLFLGFFLLWSFFFILSPRLHCLGFNATC